MSGIDDIELPSQSTDRRDSEDTTTSNSTSSNRQVKKRNRIPVSCNECRRRKLRCDRKDPCSACVQRGDADGCKFTEPISSQPKSRSAKPGSRDFLQQRIHRLEALVTDLAAQVRHSNSPPSNTDSSQSPEQRNLDQSDVSNHTSPSNTEDPAETPIDDLKIAMGDLKISNGRVMYTSGNSWNTILDEIADIKLALNPIYSSYHQAQMNAQSAGPLRPSSFPFFAVSTPSITDLLVLLPSRADTETVVQKFMTNMLTMCPCIHKPTFLRNLVEFYVAPESADPIFLGALFAVLACGISIYTENDGPTRNILMQKGVSSKKEMSFVWRDASMQAFCLGGFLTNTSLENLQGLVVLHTFLNNFQNSYSLGWPLYGIILSIALNMGLHRDGALFNIDPFETEMRRRLWSILVMLDGLNAASYGRPMMISDTQFDTKPLASMNDIDLRPGCKMPPSLPADPEAITDTTYSTCKFKLSLLVRKIMSSLFGLTPASYDQITKLDADLRATYDTFPTGIKYDSLRAAGGPRSGNVTLCVQALGLKVILNHSLVILHRPFLYRSFRDARYVGSREKCLEAAHQVLELFHEYRRNVEFIEYSWYAMGALHAFHAGTVVGLRCYLEPLTCDERDWRAVENACREFDKIAKVDGWNKLGEKGSKVFGILLRKALEKKAILEGALGSNGITIGATGQGGFDNNGALGGGGAGGFDAGLGMPTYSVDTGSSGSTAYAYTPQSLFGAPGHFDPNPLTNPALQSGDYSPSRLMGAGMPGVVVSDSSPDQANWDAFWPKGMNLTEWDMFFENMDVDFTTDSSGSTGNTNPSQSNGVMYAEQANPFSSSSNKPSMGWDFGNATFGNRVQS